MESGLPFRHDISHRLRYAYVPGYVMPMGFACVRHHSALNFLRLSRITHLAH